MSNQSIDINKKLDPEQQLVLNAIKAIEVLQNAEFEGNKALAREIQWRDLQRVVLNLKEAIANS